MQEEWHRNEWKCTFVLLVPNLLLLDLDIGADARPSIAAALPLHIPLPSRPRHAINCYCPCTVHRHCHHCIAVMPSIAVAVAPSITAAITPSIADAVAPSIAVVAVAPLLYHSSSSPPPHCCPTLHCCCQCSVHRLRHCHHCQRHPRVVYQRHRRRVAVAPCIAVAVAQSIAVALPLPCCHAFHHRPHNCIAITPSIAVHHRHHCVAVAIAPSHRHHCFCRCHHCPNCRHHHRPLLLIPSLVGCT